MKCLYLLLLCFALSDAYKVLVVYSFPVRSLNNLGEGLVRLLLNAGHEVTYITPYPRKNANHPKFRQISVSEINVLLENDNHMNISYLLQNEIEVSGDLEYLQDLCYRIAKMTFANEDVMTLLEDPSERFDVIVADYIETEIYMGLASLYECPMVWCYSMGAHWVVIRQIDDPTNPAYSADYFTSIQPPFSITERFQVLWDQIKWRYLKMFKTLPKEEEAYKNTFGPLFAMRGKRLPNYHDIMYNSSLMLSNEHYASANIPKTPQNWKLVGGFHIQEPPVPLPKELQTIMNNAENGVIYFSMGSVWKSELIPKELTDNLLRLFGELKETVIWKYEADLSSKPKNVHTIKWAPQQSILAHPNCKIFISHGGLLSSTEAIHFGVPTIGVPISYDQFLNIDKAVKRGFALKVDLSYNLPQDIKAAIKIIRDPQYKQKAKELSAIYHDRPVPPGKESVHWIEHVVRTQGALHLRSPSLKAPLYQKMYLDVLALLALAASILVFIVRSVFSFKKKPLVNKKAKRS